MFGHYFMLPIPDIDHTAYWLILGANPVASNGSLMSAPDVAKRLKAIQTRAAARGRIGPGRTRRRTPTRHRWILEDRCGALLAPAECALELGRPGSSYGDQLAGLMRRCGDRLRWTALLRRREFRRRVRTIARDSRRTSAVAYGRMGLST
jgi:hypothetical protein